MKLIQSRLDYSSYWRLPDVYLFTGNPVVKNNGAIVMGRGAAKQVRDSYSDIDKAFGTIIKQKPNAHLIWVSIHKLQHLGWFKVKTHWIDPADINLIEESTKQLKVVAEKHSDKRFHMNFPGIGNGKLESKDVLPILNTLPDNVFIYQ